MAFPLITRINADWMLYNPRPSATIRDIRGYIGARSERYRMEPRKAANRRECSLRIPRPKTQTEGPKTKLSANSATSCKIHCWVSPSLFVDPLRPPAKRIAKGRSLAAPFLLGRRLPGNQMREARRIIVFGPFARDRSTGSSIGFPRRAIGRHAAKHTRGNEKIKPSTSKSR
jgi:hypothetical protein